jgi:glycosyltransferase involved in cell wall biosynthesis
MLAGRPIVAYRTITALEILKKYPMHVLVEPNDPKSLADGIIKAIELWGNTNPSPEFNSIPTLNDVKEALIKVYNYVMNR